MMDIKEFIERYGNLYVELDSFNDSGFLYRNCDDIIRIDYKEKYEPESIFDYAKVYFKLPVISIVNGSYYTEAVQRFFTARNVHDGNHFYTWG